MVVFNVYGGFHSINSYSSACKEVNKILKLRYRKLGFRRYTSRQNYISNVGYWVIYHDMVLNTGCHISVVRLDYYLLFGFSCV